jgi:predicted ABC-class ATPase
VSAPPEGRRQKTLIQNREGGGQRTARIEFELPPAQNSKLKTLKTHSTEKFTFARSLLLSSSPFLSAGTVIAMENLQPQDVTQQAQAIAQQYTTERTPEGGTNFGKVTPTIPSPNSINPSRGKRAVKLKVRDVDEVAFGTKDIDLASVEQIVEAGQLRAIALAIVYAKEKYIDSERSLSEILDEVMNDISDQGLDIITDFPQGDLALFRRFELAAALNRLRTLQVS